MRTQPKFLTAELAESRRESLRTQGKCKEREATSALFAQLCALCALCVPNCSLQP